MGNGKKHRIEIDRRTHRQPSGDCSRSAAEATENSVFACAAAAFDATFAATCTVHVDFAFNKQNLGGAEDAASS